MFKSCVTRQRELQKIRQNKSIYAETHLKILPFKLNCLLLVFFSKILEIFSLSFPSSIVTANTKFGCSSTRVPTDTKNTLFFYLVTTETKNGQRDFFLKFLRLRTKKNKRLSFPAQRDYLGERNWVGELFWDSNFLAFKLKKRELLSFTLFCFSWVVVFSA